MSLNFNFVLNTIIIIIIIIIVVIVIIIISIIIIYNISDLILLGEKDSSYFYFINLHKLSTIKKYKNHFPFQSHYIVCKTKYMCIIFI